MHKEFNIFSIYYFSQTNTFFRQPNIFLKRFNERKLLIADRISRHNKDFDFFETRIL